MLNALLSSSRKTISATLCGFASVSAMSLPSQAAAIPQAVDPSTTLKISVSPQVSEINPGHVTTCTELDAPPPTPPSGADDPPWSHLGPAAGPHQVRQLTDRQPVLGAIRFPGFILDYTGLGKVRISYAIVKVFLPDQEYAYSLSDTEIANLLGLTDSSLTLDGPTHIVSNDPHDIRRQYPSPFAPCGLAVNEIPITIPGQGFNAHVEVKMTAFPDNPTDGQYEFEVSTSAEAEYFP